MQKTLRAEQSAQSSNGIWRKLSVCYEANKIENRNGVLSSLLHSRYGSGNEIENYLDELEKEFNKLAAMQLAVPLEMKFSILWVSLAAEKFLPSAVAALKTMEAGKIT